MKEETVDGPHRPCEHVNSGGPGLAPQRENEIDRGCSASAPPTSGATSFDLLASLTREFGLETELELSRPHVTRAIDFAFDL